MFSKILIASRGEMAMRLVRACREMGIYSIVAYEPADLGALHMRLADVCVQLDEPGNLNDGARLIQLAQEKEANAIHPGVSWLSESSDFARRCQAAGITLIGPPAEVIAAAQDKVSALKQAQDAGFATVPFIAIPDAAENAAVDAAVLAGQVGYPLWVRPRFMGRGPVERLVTEPAQLAEAVQEVATEAERLFGNGQVYLEKAYGYALLPGCLVGVQVLGDERNVIHLGERQSLPALDGRRILEESPAPCLTEEQRQILLESAVELACLFGVRNAATLQYVVDEQGAFYFSELKPRLTVNHPLTEMVGQVDLVQESIRLAGGAALALRQASTPLRGHALLARIHLEIDCHTPRIIELQRLRLPTGPHVRLDAHMEAGLPLPADPDGLVAKLTVWGEDRRLALLRMQRALEECQVVGAANNLVQLQSLMQTPEEEQGCYTLQTLATTGQQGVQSEQHLRDLAVAAAILYARRTLAAHPAPAERLASNWRRGARGGIRSAAGSILGGTNHEAECDD